MKAVRKTVRHVYVDYRLDTGEPFYVGKGTEKRVKDEQRNKHHQRIVAKHGMRRELVLSTCDNQCAIEHEMTRSTTQAGQQTSYRLNSPNRVTEY